ncbi:unnamed protein product [Parnassius apollo]|uniref:(apollo) hypothetical protein n=1 Tax=Parnassius apollo TaxID=110799 RepID=A0A8S3WWU6_PARAO|nr:unnamed protein product [Parnassius apollo]
MYEGKGDTILTTNEAENLDIGGKVVLKLSETLPEGVKLYMDRYFTSLDLLDKLRSKKMQATGTLRKANIPKNCNFKTDNELRKQGRGSSDQLVRSDGNVACLKWFDNKPVIMASSVDSKEPINKCRRWCKKTKQYIQVDRPFAIEQYNTMMGGVDMLDRVINFYRIRARSKKWTVRLILRQLLDGLYTGMKLNSREQIHIIHEVDSDDSTEEAQPWSRKRKYIPQPPVQLRTAMAGHLPLIDEQNDNHRCRMPGSIEMDISKNTALIEALLLEEIPDCDEESEAGVSDDEVENIQQPSPRGFDEVFGRALENI